MSKVTLARIKKSLLSNYGTEIDMSDYETRSDEDREQALISRALAASFVHAETNCTYSEAAAAVTDGYNDNAIDALKFDQQSDRLLIVTSGWSNAGKSKFNSAENAKFAAGVRRLLNLEIEEFNANFHSKKAEIREALTSDREIQVILAIVHTGSQSINQSALQPLQQLADEINDPVEICYVRDVPQAGVYRQITASSEDPSIDLQVTLEDWGQIKHPYLAFYGRVGISQVAGWWHEHGSALFTKNLRLYYPSSAVNSAVQKTVSERSSNFWYFNNGITLIAERIVKGIAGSPHHKFGNFSCQGASIVNGAQTVGSVGVVLSRDDIVKGDDETGYVQLRLISLESCPPEFAADMTKAANLQNAVGTREFAAMDPLHHRLALDFALDGRRYTYKSGDTDPDTASGCTITEATQALGCMISVRCATEVKREIGQIWANTNDAPYTDIFPRDLDATTLWRSVRIMRSVEKELQDVKSQHGSSKPAMVATHLNRIILHLVFRRDDVLTYLKDQTVTDEYEFDVGDMTRETFDRVQKYIEENFDNAYLVPFSKSRSKCEVMVDCILNQNSKFNLNQIEGESHPNQMDFKF